MSKPAESKLNLVIDAQDRASGELKKVVQSVDNVAQANSRLGEIDKRLSEIRKQDLAGMSTQRQELAKLRDERKALLDVAKQSAAADKAAKELAASAAMKGVEAAKQLAAAEREIMRELNDLDIALRSNVENLEGVAKAQAVLQDAESRMAFIRQQTIDAMDGEAKATARLAEEHRKAVEEVKRLEKAEKDAAASVKRAEQEATAARVAADKAQADAAQAAQKAADEAADAARKMAREQHAAALAAETASLKLTGSAKAKRELADLDSQMEFARKQSIQSLKGEARETAELTEKHKAAKEAIERLEKAEREADEARKHRKELIKSLGLTIATALAAAGAAFAKYSVDILNAAESLGQLSAKTGVSVEQLSALQDLAKRTGAPLEALAETFTKLQKKAVENPEAFTRLGIAVRDASGNVKAGNVLFGEMSDALNTIKDPAEAAAIAAGLIEDKWKDLAGAIKLGSKGIKESEDNLNSLGATTSTGFAAMAKRFNQSIADIASGIKGSITSELEAIIPVATKVTEAIANYQRGLVSAKDAAKALRDRQDLTGWEKYAQGMLLGVKGYLGLSVAQDNTAKSAKELATAQQEVANQTTKTIKGLDIKANEAMLERQKKLVESIKTSTSDAMERISAVATTALAKQKGLATEFEGLVKRIRNAYGENKLARELEGIGRKADANVARKELALEDQQKANEAAQAQNIKLLEQEVESTQKAYDEKKTSINQFALAQAKMYLDQERAGQEFMRAEQERTKKLAAIREAEKGTELDTDVARGARLSIDNELAAMTAKIKENAKAGISSDSEVERLRTILGIIEDSRKNATKLFNQKDAEEYAAKIKQLADEAGKAEAEAGIARSAKQLDALKKDLQSIDIKWSDASLQKAVDDVIKSLDDGLKLKEFAITIRPKVTDENGKVEALPKVPSYAVGGSMPSNLGNSFYIKAHKGEVMQSKPAVDFYGEDFMLALNRREIDPAIFNGGNAAAGAMSMSTTTNNNSTLSIDLLSPSGNMKLDANTTQSDVDEYIRSLRRRQS